MNVLSTETFSELLFREEELFSNYEPLFYILELCNSELYFCALS